MMYKLYVIIFCCICITSKSFTQRKFVVGLLQDSITLFPIKNGTIINQTTKESTNSNENGLFRIEAAPNDYIYAYAKSYHHDTVNYSLIFKDTIVISLSPSGNILPNVVVKGQYTRYQLDSMERKADFDAAMGNRMPTFSSSHPSGFGLTLSLDKFFKKKYKNQRAEERSFSNVEKMSYVDYRFSPLVVHYYTGFKGEVLRDFMKRYTPDYKWLRDHPTNEDVMYYINDRLKDYRDLDKK